MFEVGTKVHRKYESGTIGPATPITWRSVVRDHCDNTAEIVYVLGDGSCYTEEQLLQKYVFVDKEATRLINR